MPAADDEGDRITARGAHGRQGTAGGGDPVAGIRAELDRMRSALQRAEAELARLEGSAPVPRRTPRPDRYYRVLLAVYEHGRHGVGNGRFGDLGREHGYDPRGLGGFFAGAQAPLRLRDDRVTLTVEGQRLLDEYLQERMA